MLKKKEGKGIDGVDRGGKSGLGRFFRGVDILVEI